MADAGNVRCGRRHGRAKALRNPFAFAPLHGPPVADPHLRAVRITRHSDALAVLRAAEVGVEEPALGRPGDGQTQDVLALERVFTAFSLFQNGPRHGPARQLLTNALKVVSSAYRPSTIVATLDGLLADRAAGVPFDIVPLMTNALPMRLLADSLRLDPGRARRIAKAAALIGSSQFLGAPAAGALAGGALRQLAGVAVRMEADARAAIAASGDPAGLEALFSPPPGHRDPDPALSLAYLLETATETTGSLLATALALCLLNEAVGAHFCHEGQPSRRAVAELIRLAASSRLARSRIARGSVSGDGWTIAPGSRIIVDLAAANSDPRAFDAPSTFDVAREGPGHLGFGGGAHRCIGAQVATTVLTTVLSHLLRDRDARLAMAEVARAQASFVRPERLIVTIRN